MRVLVVEDEHKIANSIRQGLEQENYAVDVAYDGVTGLDLATSEEFDIIILDRLLPGFEGVEIAKEVRIKNIHTPILMLTAKGQISDKVEGLNSGADDYLVKPFAFLELLARIRALSRRPEKTLDNKIAVSDLTLDVNKFEVKRKTKSITLSKKEFSLLEYLMKHKGQIVKKEQIMNHVWDYDSNILPNSVEVYIKHLRDKLGKPELIKTVRGFGYKIG